MAGPQFRAMPRFYFDAFDNGVSVLDDRGVELPNAAVAREHAAMALPRIARNALSAEDDHREFAIVVRDAERRRLFRVTLAFSVEVLS